MRPDRPFHNRGSSEILKKLLRMILFVAVNFKKLLKQQRDYDWPRPKICPRCAQSGLWGHGFVLVYFDGLPVGVLLRRYRCPGCHCVIRLRPEGYFSRFQASIDTIFRSLTRRLAKGLYLAGISHNRQRHWLVGLIRNTAAYFGNAWLNRLVEAFGRLQAMGKVPVSSSI
jgi:hypothetical protein